MKAFYLAAAAALGLTFAASPSTAEAGGCYTGGYGYNAGFGSGFGYGGGFGGGYGLGYGYVPPQPAFVPVRRHRDHFHPVAGPVYPRGFHGYNFGRRSGIAISTPGFGIRFGY